ncbi:hypothetical protein ANO11243_017530 [Dothideomycetidae sp. 11243]|nr:hypothetical protein ANO11243_017530 [fungal sp. No.11243]
MSATTYTHIPTAAPQTPPRCTSTDDKEPTPPSSDTFGSNKLDHLSTDSDESDHIAPPPPNPFLAYARRVRSFSSPLKKNRTRYLLTFVDADAAADWWALMQHEYPDSVRESSQLFSFKSDRVPAKAWENPRFAHLKDKWTFRQLEDKENYASPERSAEKHPRLSKRGSLLRMLSTPVLGTIGEMPHSRSRDVSPAHLTEDPFTEPTPPHSIEASIDFGELNRMLERMQMMMNQTQLRIDVLAERQQLYVESLERLQSGLEANSTHIQALASQHQLSAITTKNMRLAIEQNASHMRTILEKHVHDIDREQQMENKMQSYTQRVEEVMDLQRASHLELREVKSSTGNTADRMQTMLDKQKDGDKKLDAIMASLDQVSIDTKKPSSPRSSTATPSAGGMQRLQTSIEQQSAQLAGLITAQKTGNKHNLKMQASLESLGESNEQKMEKRIEQMQAAHKKEMKELRREMTKLMNEKIEKMQAVHEEHHEVLVKAIEARSRPVRKTVVQCDHDVAPPPRKMNREMLGYWYKRPG